MRRRTLAGLAALAVAAGGENAPSGAAADPASDAGPARTL